MIAPTKHVPEDKALLGVGAELLKELLDPQTVTGLWEKARFIDSVGTYERFVLALDMLFLIGAIDIKHGLIQRIK